MPALKSDDLERPRGQKLTSAGFVYVVTSDHGSKIGVSANPRKRITQISQSVPFSIEVVAVFKVENMRLVEKELLSKFSTKRIRGEWFRLDALDLSSLGEYGVAGMDERNVSAIPWL